ncbi:MAG TPA: hypothetical protein VFT22_41115 [Kofleriaceae bacterium]|nr:hypothetical protein [Kofleriaceae bacterium]
MRSAVIAIFGALLAACQDSNVSREVGARCDVSADCDQRCLPPGSDYPGGFCTIACSTRADCPGATTCADREGGVCLYTCTGDADCGFLGTGWRCGDADLRGGGIKVMVCRGG